MILTQSQSLFDKTTQIIANHLESKTHRQFSLDSKNADDVLVRGFFDLIKLYLFRNLRSYQQMYLSGAFETKNLVELMSVLPQGRQYEDSSRIFENIANLYSQPKVFLPFLFEDDMKFVGFYPQLRSSEHLDFIAEILEVNPLDNLLEVGLSQGPGQIYLAQKYKPNIHTVALSKSHRQSLESGMNIHVEKDQVQIVSIDSITAVKGQYSKVIVNSFFEAFYPKSIERLFSTLIHASCHKKKTQLYIQGLFPPNYKKVINQLFNKPVIKKVYSLQDSALETVKKKESLLYQYSDTMGDIFYRTWRLYFVQQYLSMIRQENTALGLFIEY